MTNDTYISGLCRINKHAEQLSILRGIDRRGSTSAEKHLVALFRIGVGGNGGKQAETAHSFLNYNKPPTTVNNQKSITGSAASGDIVWRRWRRRTARHSEKAEWPFVKICMTLWTGTWVILTAAPAHVYMAVVCRVWADGWRYGPSLVPRLDRSSWQIALQSSFSCSSPWGAVIDDSHCHLDPFSPPIWLLTGRVESCSSLSLSLSPSLSSPFKFECAHFRRGVYQQSDCKTSTLNKLKTETEIIWTKCLSKPFWSWTLEIRKVKGEKKLTVRCLQA